MYSINEAQKMIANCVRNFGTEIISIDDAYNRILAEDIIADRDYPPFNRATMDGYAVNSADFIDKKTKLKLIGTLYAGSVSEQIVAEGTCLKIMTGAPVPEGADAVVRVEDTIQNESIIVFKAHSVSPFQNIAKQGQDSIFRDLILEKNTMLNALSISVLAVTGKSTVKVYKIPEVAVVSTGNEIVSVQDVILPFQIRDSNVYSLKNFLKQYHITTVKSKLIKDDKAALIIELNEFLNEDILIITGGVSKGEADYIPEVLKSLGVEEIFHRVKIKPGNPLWFGKLPNGGVVFGLPGNPVSVQVAYKVFIEPYLRNCLNLKKITPVYFPVMEKKNKKTNFTEYFPCNLISKNNISGLISKSMNTSGDITATLDTDGIAIHPESMETINENEPVEFYFW
jgi:molybdopterin molybdotransferase